MATTNHNANWFNGQKDAFKNVERADGHINLDDFFPAAEGFITILDTQKAKVFIPIRDRFRNNVGQMRNFAARFPECKTIHSLIKKESEIGESDIDVPSASRGVLWFTRACQFLIEAFRRSLNDPDEALSTSFQESYNISLCKYHDGIVRRLFALAMMLCPGRDTFYKQLANDDTFKILKDDAVEYFKHMSRVKDRLVQYCRYRHWKVDFRDESANIYENARKRKAEEQSDTGIDTKVEPAQSKELPTEADIDQALHEFQKEAQLQTQNYEKRIATRTNTQRDSVA